MRTILSLSALAAVLLLWAQADASPYPLAQILDQAAADKLAKQEIKTSDELLQRAATQKDRLALVKATALPLKWLTAWAKMCDLLRIKGVGPEIVRLLDAGGVSTVKQLRTQNAAALHKKLTQANNKKKITENPPTADQLGAWIEQAKKLKLVLR